jgi:hypothetical protein
MTFEEHLQAAIKRQKEDEERVRHQTGEARAVLLPLRDSQAIQHQFREILLASGEQPVE